MRQIVELVRGQGATALLTSYVPGEGGPAGFYARLGFVPTGHEFSEVVEHDHAVASEHPSLIVVFNDHVCNITVFPAHARG